MNILVCIKQVPASNNVGIDDETGTIKRSGAESKMNACDLCAIEAALQIAQEKNVEVDVITMGPGQAIEILDEALSMGASKAALITDKAFAGSDVLATSYTIAQGIKKFGNYDLILCGQQTTDGDTAQVGAEIAEALGIDHANYVSKVLDVSDSKIKVSMNLGDYSYVQNMKLPCLLTIEKDSNVPRLPSYKRKIKITDNQKQIITLNDFEDKNLKHYGLDGSPTTVVKVFSPESNVVKKTMSGSSEDIANELVSEIKDKKII